MSLPPALLARAPVALPHDTLARVVSAYTEPHRAYHTLQHLEELAGHWRAVDDGPGWRDRRSSWLALLFHDAVYAVGTAHGANEAASAALLDALVADTAEARRLILLTAAHGDALDGLDADAAHFLDADMAILGADPARFAEYEAQVRAEYTPLVGADAYTSGRRAFLEKVLATPRIFLSRFFFDRFEAQARANLAAAVAR
jgi:predicted metal-dependent HD superfamily phosphohydrolase